MERITVELQMKMGLSLKMSARIADAAARCNVRGFLRKGEQTYNIGSVLQMASSGINERDMIDVVVCNGARAQEAMDAIVEILQQEED